MSHAVETLKSQGRYFAAGAQARYEGGLAAYGCHYGMRSTRQSAIDQFMQGYNAKPFVIVLRVKGGDVYEVPVIGHRHWRHAVRHVLTFLGLHVADVILCK